MGGVGIQSIELLYVILYIVNPFWVVGRIVGGVWIQSIDLLYVNLYIVDPFWVVGRIVWVVFEYCLLNYFMLTSK